MKAIIEIKEFPYAMKLKHIPPGFYRRNDGKIIYHTGVDACSTNHIISDRVMEIIDHKSIMTLNEIFASEEETKETVPASLVLDIIKVMMGK